MSAIKISPKSVCRQRSLAEAAEKNNDLTQAELSRRKAVEVGRSSYLKKSSDYTSLAKIYIDNGSHQKAAETLNQTIKTFKNEDGTVLKSTIKLSTAYKNLKLTEKFRSTVNTSIQLADKNNHLLHGESALELARRCMDVGNKEKGEKILMSVAKEYHENAQVIQSIQEIFEEANMADKGSELIIRAREEVIELNNKGVKLISDGKIKEAIILFQLAVKQMPGNITINLNVATALFLQMKNDGLNDKTKKTIFNYLDIAFHDDPDSTKALDIKNKCLALS